MTKHLLQYVRNVLAPALQIQITLAVGFIFTLVVSYFYIYINDSNYPIEKPEVIWAGLGVSLGLFLIGNLISRKQPFDEKFNWQRGAFITVNTWIIACATSAFVFVLAGFPDPAATEKYSLFRRFTDGFFESMSGFTTAGTSILPNIEAFPRSVLMWRSLTHWFGGVGIAYFALTIWKGFKINRGEIINGEVETPHHIIFKDEKEAIKSGWDFIKVFGLMTVILVVLLIASGYWFREVAYTHWYENVYDAINHAFSTMGTGGFSSYNNSAGLPNPDGTIGGLRNPMSEWIIAIFMMFAGMNFSLWYGLFFEKGGLKKMFKSTELKYYLGMVFSIVFGIWLVLLYNHTFDTWGHALRHSLFNVTTIVSTTGLAVSDFALWPAAAQGLLFICYLVGGMVGSTAGGLKVGRFLVIFKYSILRIRELLTGKKKKTFVIDDIRYSDSSVSLIMISVLTYFAVFMIGAILIMVVSPKVVFYDGSVMNIDYTSAITASIANLGNIGPAVVVGNVNSGPTGNYFAYSVAAKWVLTTLMFIGRIGILTMLMLFVKKKYQNRLQNDVAEVDSDACLAIR